MKAIHFDPKVYLNPDRCDLFRFAKLRDRECCDSKYGFATIDSHVRPCHAIIVDVAFLIGPNSTFHLVLVLNCSVLLVQDVHSVIQVDMRVLVVSLPL